MPLPAVLIQRKPANDADPHGDTMTPAERWSLLAVKALMVVVFAFVLWRLAVYSIERGVF